MAVIAFVPLLADKHVHEFIDGHAVAIVVYEARLEGIVHPIEFQLLELLQGVLVHFDFHD